MKPDKEGACPKCGEEIDRIKAPVSFFPYRCRCGLWMIDGITWEYVPFTKESNQP